MTAPHAKAVEVERQVLPEGWRLSVGRGVVPEIIYITIECPGGHMGIQCGDRDVNQRIAERLEADLAAAPHSARSATPDAAPVAQIIATPEATHPHAAGETDVEWLQDWMRLPVGTQLYTAPTPTAAPSPRTYDDALRIAADPERDRPAAQSPNRHLTVTTDEAGRAVLVSWQDDEHRILETVWEAQSPDAQGGEAAVAVMIEHPADRKGFSGNANGSLLFIDPPFSRMKVGDKLYTHPADAAVQGDGDGEWRPIAEAPDILVQFWIPEHEGWPWADMAWNGLRRGDLLLIYTPFRTEGRGVVTEIPASRATHWRPLPPPPSDLALSGAGGGGA